MIRTILSSMAIVVLTGALANGAAPPKPGVEAGFRVYTVSPRCLSRNLVGVYATAGEAFEVASGLRAKSPPSRLEVTTGSEGTKLPTGRNRAILYQVYTKVCDKSGWQGQELYAQAEQAAEAAKTHEKDSKKVEIVCDYTAKEVYHVYGRRCRTAVGTKSHLMGTYRTARAAFDAADDIRTKQPIQCEVVTGTKGEELLDGTPIRYTVYNRGCRIGLASPKTTADRAEAMKDFQARIEQKSVAVMVVHYDPNAMQVAPSAFGYFDGKVVQLPRKSAAGGVESTAALLKSCSDHSEGTAADLAAARTGDHVRLTFTQPREFEVDGKKVRVTELVVVLPVDKGVLWVRSGSKVFRETKFDHKKWAAYKAWLDAARADG